MKQGAGGTGRRAGVAVFCAGLMGAGAVLAEQPELHVHGFVSQGYLHSSANNYLADTEAGTFEFFEAGVNVATELTDQLRLGMQLFSRNLGRQGNFDVVIDWAYADYRWRDELGIRLGRVKTPFGLYNQTRDLDFLHTQAILPTSIYHEEFRDILVATSGGGVYGHIPAAGLGAFSYEAVGGAVQIDENLPMIRNSVAAIPALVTDVDVSARYLYAGSLQWHTPVDGLRLAGSYLRIHTRTTMRGPELAAENRMQLDGYIMSAEYVLGHLTLAAEYGVADTDIRTGGSPLEAMPFQPEGYYGSVAYRFTDWLEIGAYYSEYYSDRDDRSGRRFTAIGQPDHLGWQKDAALTVRFDVNEHWTVKLEAHDIDGGAQVYLVDNPDGIKRKWQLYVVKTTFTF